MSVIHHHTPSSSATITSTPGTSSFFSPTPGVVESVPLPSGWRLLVPNTCHIFPRNLFTADNLPRDMASQHRIRCLAFIESPVAFRITCSADPEAVGSETATLCPICGLIVRDNWVTTRNGRLRRQLRIESLREHLGMRHHLMHRVQCPAQCDTVCASRGYTKPHRLLHHWSDNIACLAWVSERVHDDETLLGLVQWSLGATWKRLSTNRHINPITAPNPGMPEYPHAEPIDLRKLLIDRAAHVRKVTHARMQELMSRASNLPNSRGLGSYSVTTGVPAGWPESMDRSATPSASPTQMPTPPRAPTFSLTQPLDLSASQAGVFGAVSNNNNSHASTEALLPVTTPAENPRAVSMTPPVNPVYSSVFDPYAHLNPQRPVQLRISHPFTLPNSSQVMQQQSFALPHPYPHLQTTLPHPHLFPVLSPLDSTPHLQQQQLNKLPVNATSGSTINTSARNWPLNRPDSWPVRHRSNIRSLDLGQPVTPLTWISPTPCSLPTSPNSTTDSLFTHHLHLRQLQPQHGPPAWDSAHSLNSAVQPVATPADVDDVHPSSNNGSLESLLALEDLGFRFGQAVQE